jgi:hypothetical protein
MIVNFKTANMFGLTVPLSLLGRPTRRSNNDPLPLTKRMQDQF